MQVMLNLGDSFGWLHEDKCPIGEGPMISAINKTMWSG